MPPGTAYDFDVNLDYTFLKNMQSIEHESEERVTSACVSKMHEKSYILLLDKIYENIGAYK
jgi:hypothetical protein